MDDFIVNVVAGFIVLVVILVIIFAFWGIRFSQVGQGEHSGFITAVDQRGYVFRNYDVYFKTDNSSSQEDEYCINRNNIGLIEKAKKANKLRKQVTLHYEGVRGIGLGLCMGSEITAIE